MAGNELEVVEYLFNNKDKIELNHIGIVNEIGNPEKNKKGIVNVETYEELNSIKTANANKKADIFLNEKGVSIKQKNGNFLFNRLQRAGIVSLFKLLNLDLDVNEFLEKFDAEVVKYHTQIRENREIKWQSFFSEADFKKILKYLMMEGSPNKKSAYPAEYILDAPKGIKKDSDIKVYTFDEFFDKYRTQIVFAIRRQWIGQKSNSENKRAVGLAKKRENQQWVFEDVVGEPREWNTDFPIDQRRTVYFLMIELLSE
ncbi:hypothetical protein GMB50_10610 [Turicibacter sanguinis]|nr:hypothetical protein [Turicibacter sanguinis]MTP47971.1 hypothetical protein [Turicibacter sanguinis]MTP50719.1 hypothetical protein [Turicibacter sanguinis]MTQ07955.1 hypothetical protein [Turicibacter sanguinis]